MNAAKPVGALVVDNSDADRSRLVTLLTSDSSMAVVGEAARFEQAVAMTRLLRPHVVVMAARQSGTLDAVRQIMIEAPTPIILAVDETEAAQAAISVSALRAGALAVVPKPWTLAQPDPLEADARRFVATVKAMSQVKVIHHWQERRPVASPPAKVTAKRLPVRAVAIAASTGGPAALQQLLAELPADFPAPILVVQHIAHGFVGALAESLDSHCALDVRVASQGEPLKCGTVFVAPDGSHLGVSQQSNIALLKVDPVGGFRPSATILFESVAKAFGASSAHVILTGMGRDGVAGLQVAHQLGGKIMAQDEASSIVFGMPGEAINAGVVDQIAPVRSIARELIALSSSRLPA